jgi:hypothetical protein
MQVEAHAEILALWLSAYAMDPHPTGLSTPAIKEPMLPIARGVGYRRHSLTGQARVTDLMTAPAPYGKVCGAAPVAAPVMGDGAPAEDGAPTEDDRDEAEDESKIPLGVVRRRHPQKVAISACSPW